ncbi:hypothetical protein EMUCRT_0807 [Ehrlichia cf. muris str. EmCRT]|uniref:Uncharacterized protein n=1 Tax=Ehrlichia cf. muris str. EmCRT TaxID=1359167 RepID=A0A0F3N5I3_9RICK|nr:hypothetical protein EMUCRT_0807 [Ehrlichia cf. muris str. EmCRT]
MLQHDPDLVVHVDNYLHLRQFNVLTLKDVAMFMEIIMYIFVYLRQLCKLR